MHPLHLQFRLDKETDPWALSCSIMKWKKYFKLVAFRIFSGTELPTFPKQNLSVKRQSLSVLVNSIRHLYFEAIDQGGCSLYSL